MACSCSGFLARVLGQKLKKRCEPLGQECTRGRGGVGLDRNCADRIAFVQACSWLLSVMTPRRPIELRHGDNVEGCIKNRHGGPRRKHKGQLRQCTAACLEMRRKKPALPVRKNIERRARTGIDLDEMKGIAGDEEIDAVQSDELRRLGDAHGDAGERGFEPRSKIRRLCCAAEMKWPLGRRRRPLFAEAQHLRRGAICRPPPPPACFKSQPAGSAGGTKLISGCGIAKRRQRSRSCSGSFTRATISGALPQMLKCRARADRSSGRSSNPPP